MENCFTMFCCLFLSCAQLLSHARLFLAPWTVAHQAPLPMEFSRQEYWSGLPFPSPGNLPNPGIKSASPISPALAGRFFTTSATWEVQCKSIIIIYKYVYPLSSEPPSPLPVPPPKSSQSSRLGSLCYRATSH